MDLGLRGRRALVFGASRGLGFAVADELAREGARVCAVSRDGGRIEAAAAHLSRHGEPAMALCADLGAPGAARAATARAIQELGGLDILVCNSGGPPKAVFAEVDAAAWSAGFQNLWLSTTDAMAVALPVMIAGGFGRILLVTSVAAKEPMPGLTVSNGLRAGLLGLVKSVAPEVAAQGVTINALLPGYTRTERMTEIGVSDAQVAAQVPMRRMGEPQEFAALAAFLASARAGYITGQAIAVDGGWLRGS
ncbi:MAG: SDR family oxidoreductase [Deltaproteobacteria bacterium]|nr:SDR family oxidoreductase [Deltaproteobacteria bacterium]